MCHRNGYDVKAKKFGNDFSKKNEKAVNTNYKQVRGLAAVSRPGVKSPAGDTVIGFWLSSDWHQTKGCKIQMGSLNNGRTKMNFGKILNFRSHFSPAVTWFDNKFVLAFTDGSTGKLNIATSANGKTWSRKTTTAAAFSAPSITVFNGQLYLSWVAPSPYVPWPNNTRGQVKIGTLKPDGRSYTIASSKKVTCHNATAFSPSICASDKNLFLAYTDSNNKIEIMNSTRTSGWTQYKAFQTKSAIAPTLFFLRTSLFVPDEPTLHHRISGHAMQAQKNEPNWTRLSHSQHALLPEFITLICGYPPILPGDETQSGAGLSAHPVVLIPVQTSRMHAQFS